MEAKTQFKTILKGIKVEQFAIFDENYVHKQPVSLNTQVKLKINVSEKQLGVFLRFDFLQNEKTFITIEVSCHFKIDPESWESRINDAHIIFSRDNIGHLLMITLGTARGVLFAKTDGTVYSNYILPLLDVNDLAGEDTVFDLNTE